MHNEQPVQNLKQLLKKSFVSVTIPAAKALWAFPSPKYLGLQSISWHSTVVGRNSAKAKNCWRCPALYYSREIGCIGASERIESSKEWSNDFLAFIILFYNCNHCSLPQLLLLQCVHYKSMASLRDMYTPFPLKVHRSGCHGVLQPITWQDWIRWPCIALRDVRATSPLYSVLCFYIKVDAFVLGE